MGSSQPPPTLPQNIPIPGCVWKESPQLCCVSQGITSLGSLEEMPQEQNAQLDELKFQLMCAHQLMKNNADKHRRDVHFVEGDDVFLKLQPYR